MKKEYTNIKDIQKLAKECGVDTNPLFVSTLHNYETVQLSIESIHNTLKSESITVNKEYVKGRENKYINPVIKELPRLVDIANKTMNSMLSIIRQFGHIKGQDALTDFLNGY